MVKVHNSKADRKLEVRRRMLARLDRPEVLELYAGPGKMRHDVYAGAVVCGIDTDIRSVAEYIGPAEHVVRCLDLDRFNVYDADAFAAPWEALWHIGRIATPNRDVVVFVTDGGFGGASNMNPTFARKGWSRQMMEAIGVDPSDCPAGMVTGKEAAARAAHRLIASFFDRWTVGQYVSSWGGKSGGCLYAGALLHPQRRVG